MSRLSFSQERLWLLEQLGTAGSAYNAPYALRLLGPLDMSALERSLAELIRRHEILRTRIDNVDGTGMQWTADACESALPVHDLSALPSCQREGRLQELMRHQFREPFALSSQRLLRVLLVRLAPREHVLLMTMHHVVADGWSVNRVLPRELGVLYEAYSRCSPPALADLPIQYADYAKWQREWLQGELFEQQLRYWRRKLEGMAALNLPTDRPRPVRGTLQGASIPWLLPEATLKTLHELSHHEGVTLHLAVLAGFQAVLSRWAGQEDIAIGTVVSGRTHPQTEGLIGCFVNTLVMRTDLSGNPGFRELLRRVREVARDAYAHQDLPFDRLVADLQPDRDPARQPLIQVMINSQYIPEDAAWGSVRTERIRIAPWTSKFDLLLDLYRGSFGLQGRLEYATDLFEQETIERFAGHLRTLLAAAADAPDRAIGELPMLEETERRQLLVSFNATQATYPQERCVHELFEDQVRRTPAAVALTYRNERLTYEQLNEQANRLAHYLRAQGVAPESRVAVCMERSSEMVIALLAILKAGGAYVPLDPRYPGQRLGYMLSDSDPVMLLTLAGARPALRDLQGSVPVVDLRSDAYQWCECSTRDPDRREIGLAAQHLAYVIYTSGSTGEPKGVMVEHRNFVNFLTWHHSVIGVSPGKYSSSVASIGFDVGSWEIWSALCAGGGLIMCPPEISSDPEALLRWWAAQDLDVSFLPTPVADLAFARGIDNSALRKLLVGGDRLTRLPAWPASFEVLNNYGPTECTVVATSAVLRKTCGVLHIGRPIANTQVYILDPQGEPVPIGVAGEIYIAGAGVARGYLGRQRLTAERFLPDRFASSPGGRMYRTGDIGRWRADGTIEYLGRNDDQVKIRGFRVECGEIEARLRECAGIRDAVVVARSDRTGDRRLVAYFTAEAPDKASPAQLRGELLRMLPEYMVPAAFVLMDRLPLTTNGKIDRKALPVPEASAHAEREYEAPRGRLEEELAILWQEVLGAERVGRGDNFFELGGHSLLAVRLMDLLRRRGLSTDVRTVFAAPTLASLAATLGSYRDVFTPPNLLDPGSSVLTPAMLPLIDLSQADIDHIIAQVPGGVANIQDVYALSPLQDGILFHHLLAAEGDPYLLIAHMIFPERTLLDRYLATLQQIVDRHDILRSAFLWRQLSRPSQVVLRRAPLIVTEVTLDPKGGPAAGQMRQRFHPRQHRIDLTQAPLLRIAIAREPASERWIVMQLLHHLVGDHSTLEVLRTEVQTLLAGGAQTLPPPQPFRNLIAQAQRGLSPEEHERFFRTMLGDIEEPTFPFGLTDVHSAAEPISEARRMLPPQLHHRLRSQARRLGVSLASLCHLAWGQVIARASGRSSVVFGTVLFGRMHAGIGAHQAMGLFINTLPLRLDLDERGVESSVHCTHARLAELLGHEHASLALAQRCSGVRAPAPLFSALLNYRHNVTPVAAERDQSEGPLREVQWLGAEERTNYPVVLSVEDSGHALGLTAQSVSPLSSERLCGYMQEALEQLSHALSEVPGMPVRRLQVVPAGERTLLLQTWNGTGVRCSKGLCIHQAFEHQVERTPHAPALLFECRSLSYSELNSSANRLAHQLIALGVHPDEPVAICFERGPEMVIGLIAILKAGGAYVPLDPAYPSARLTEILQEAAPRILLCDESGRRALGESACEALTVLDLTGQDVPWSQLPATNPDSGALGLTSRHLAYVIYTSGSTGTPKGVMVEHTQVVRLFEATQELYRFGQDDVWCLTHSLAFDFSVWELWGALLHGGRLIVVPRDIVRSAVDLHRLICECGVTVLNQTPSAFSAFLDAMSQVETQHRLRYVIFGGEVLEPHALQRWYARYPDRPPQLVNMYGITEATVHSTFRILWSGDCSHSPSGSPIGKPLSDVRIYVLDSTDGEPVPLGAAGEIYIGGAGVARGYLNRPDLTAKRFLPDPFSPEPGARMYRTGDLARHLPDGTLLFLGRNDRQVKVRGFRIEPGEIEAHLIAHPAVKEAVVIAREDIRGSKRLVAYLTCPPATGMSSQNLAPRLRAHLSARLPEYMLPAAFVRLDVLPLTPNGKLDRRALPAPEADTFARETYEAPRGAVEQTIAALWEELLGVSPIGRHDDFFELGGHSLLCVYLLSGLQDSFGIELPLASLFAHPRLSALASVVSESGPRIVGT